MLKDEFVKIITRQLRLVYYNNYLLKVGAITNRQHRLMYEEILKRTSVRKLIEDNVTYKI